MAGQLSRRVDRRGPARSILPSPRVGGEGLGVREPAATRPPHPQPLSTIGIRERGEANEVDHHGRPGIGAKGELCYWECKSVGPVRGMSTQNRHSTELRVLTLQLQPGLPAPKGAGEVHTCTFSPDGRYVLSGGWDGHLRQWNPADGTVLKALKVSDKPVSACAVSPNGGRWLSGTLEGFLACWDPLTQTRTSVFLAHNRPVSSIVFAPDSRTLATSSWDRQVILWDAARE